MWQVEYTDEFAVWFGGKELDESDRESIAASVDLLERHGAALGRPRVDTLKGSRHPHMKELRVRHRRRVFRIFLAFDPRRHAILLIGGDKRADKRFYERMIPLADRLYDEYLSEIRKEGLI